MKKRLKNLRFSLVVLAFIFTKANSQSIVYKIQYKENLSFNIAHEKYWTLYVGEQESLFDLEKSNYMEQRRKALNNFDPDSIAKAHSGGDSYKIIQLAPLNSNISKKKNVKKKEKPAKKRTAIYGFYEMTSGGELIYQSHTGGKAYVIKEKIPKIDWQITEQTKQIGNYKCQKATAIFRGRKYNVWFTFDLPVPFGPWKLNGLPGAVLEYYDEAKQIYGIATKIETVNRTQMDIAKSIIIPKGDTISLKAFVELKNKAVMDRKNTIRAQLGIRKEQSFIPSQFNTPEEVYQRRGEFELFYEWEKDEFPSFRPYIKK